MTGNTVKLLVELSERAITPTRVLQGAAGMDLHSAYDYIVLDEGKALIETDLQMVIPKRCYGRIAPARVWRSYLF